MAASPRILTVSLVYYYTSRPYYCTKNPASRNLRNKIDSAIRRKVLSARRFLYKLGSLKLRAPISSKIDTLTQQLRAILSMSLHDVLYVQHSHKVSVTSVSQAHSCVEPELTQVILLVEIVNT